MSTTGVPAVQCRENPSQVTEISPARTGNSGTFLKSVDFDFPAFRVKGDMSSSPDRAVRQLSLFRRAKLILQSLRKKLVRKPPLKSQSFERYVMEAPSHQNAIDLVPGWSTAFPPELGLKAGALETFHDARIRWAIQCFGHMKDKQILELGPLEAGHTCMLEKEGAKVDAVEANQLAYLRCLIAKEILGMTLSRFWLGDFVKWLELSNVHYDLILASGVLYHMRDPLRLIDLIAKRSSAVFFWTHLVDEEAMPMGDPRRFVFAPEIEVRDFHGVQVRCYRRTYLQAPIDPAFCGGSEDEHRWLNRDDFLAALRAVGFDDIRTAHDEPQHKFGPALSVYASKL